MKALLSLIIVAAATTTSVSGQGPEPSAAALAAFTEAFNKRDAAALAGLFDENAILLPPGGAVVNGRPAIQAHFETLLKTAGAISFAEIVSTTSGQVAHSAGTFTLKTGNPSGLMMLGVGGGTRSSAHKYAALLQRTGNAWRFRAYIWNDDAAPAP